MYNKFRSTKTDGVFVYGLTDRDNIFYVGITGFLQFRYKQHFVEQLCGSYIWAMRTQNEYPGIVILGIFDTSNEAEAAEHSLIRCLSFMGNKLLNSHQNPHENKLQIPLQLSPNTSRPSRMPNKLFKSLITKSLIEYNTFRKWEPREIWERSR